jgi:hypothetical protein
MPSDLLEYSQRVPRHGGDRPGRGATPLEVPSMAKPTTAERFWAKVERPGPDDCWPWLAAKDSSGYGHMYVDGRLVLAHRFAYELLVGSITAGLTLDHLCRVRHCVNVAHLEPVTRRTNTLRGETIAAAEASQTHCKHGHPFDEANTYYRRRRGRLHRSCRACNLAAVRRYKLRRVWP